MIPPCHTAFLSLPSALCLCASLDFFFFKTPSQPLSSPSPPLYLLVSIRGFIWLNLTVCFDCSCYFRTMSTKFPLLAALLGLPVWRLSQVCYEFIFFKWERKQVVAQSGPTNLSVFVYTQMLMWTRVWSPFAPSAFLTNLNNYSCLAAVTFSFLLTQTRCTSWSCQPAPRGGEVKMGYVMLTGDDGFPKVLNNLCLHCQNRELVSGYI